MTGAERNPLERSNLRIWQQNLNKSHDAQRDLLAGAKPEEWDLIFIQEPYLDTIVSNTRANHHWVVHYPPTHLIEGQRRTRSIILINIAISSNAYRTLPIFSPDVTGIEFLTNAGKITLFNVYNSCTDNASILTLGNYLSSNSHTSARAPTDHMYWLGDFNRHHPLWEEERNAHLESAEDLITPLLDLLTEHEMILTLPAGIPTLQAHNSGNWTRPDNVWRKDQATDLTITCDVHPELRPPKTDHLPIVTVIDISPPKVRTQPRRAFRNADWTAFREKLTEEAQRTAFIRNPTTTDDLDNLTRQISEVVSKAIEETVPLTKPSPHMKRWWSQELTTARREKNKQSGISYKWRGDPTHPSHREHVEANARYVDLMQTTIDKHWYQFLNNATGRDLWTASKYISKPATDGGQTRVPELKTGPNVEDKARTNDEKARALAKTFFIPKDRDFSTPQLLNPLPELNPLTPYSSQRIRNKAGSLKRNKAPGPDGIPNEVWICCIDVLIDQVTTLFNGAMNMGYYPKAWRTSTTIVLRKPGKPAYDVPKAFRPIALLNTLGKLLSGLIADDLGYLCEANNLLSERAYGGRPGRVTTDAIHLITHRVKDAWRNRRVASVLFLDIQAAFPNLVPERLIYDMKMLGLPAMYTTIVSSILKDRTTHLHFDDHVSEAIPINNGSDQGNPLSVVLYNIYHSDLTKTPQDKTEDATGYIDDATLFAEGANFTQTNAKLKDMMERDGGALQWSRTHASPFEASKLAVMHFAPPQPVDKIAPPLVITNELRNGTETTFTVEEAENYKYLGVLINRKLSWKPQHSLVHARAVRYTNLFRRLMKTTKGISFAGARMIYNAVAVSQINYACDVWYSPPAHSPEDVSTKGSIGITKKLTSVQRQATIAITGALRTTAADTLEVHAGIPPVQVRLSRLCNLAAARIATLPDKHPLHKIAKAKARRLVKKHRTALHLLFHATEVNPACMEKIAPMRRPPNYRPAHSTRIDPSKEAALTHDNETQDRGIRIYTDGSGYKDNIGAAAVLYDNGRRTSTLRYHLGTISEHTVYEGEIVGILLGLKLAARSRAATNGRLSVSISLDNTSVITATNNQESKPSQYLLDWVHDAMADLDEDLVERLEIKWVPGHMNSRGNEAADVEAKKAAEGDSSPARELPQRLRDTLPVSLSATRQKLTTMSHRFWDNIWKKSHRFRHARRIAGKASSPKYVKLVKNRKRKQTSVLTQLRTRHIPLNFYLYRIKKIDNADCPHCPGHIEDIEHYLFSCKAYHTARTELRNEVGRKSTSIGYLLGTVEGTKQLLRYMHNTKRFEHTLGNLWGPEDEIENVGNPEEAEMQIEEREPNQPVQPPQDSPFRLAQPLPLPLPTNHS